MSAETVGIGTSPGMGVESISGPPGSLTSTPEAPNFSSPSFISPESPITSNQTDIFNSTRPFQVSESDFTAIFANEGPIGPNAAQLSIPIEFTAPETSFSPPGLEATEFPALEMPPLNAQELAELVKDAPVYDPREIEEFDGLPDFAGLAGDTTNDGLVSPSEEVLMRADTYQAEERVEVPAGIAASLLETNLDPDQVEVELVKNEIAIKPDALATYQSEASELTTIEETSTAPVVEEVAHAIIEETNRKPQPEEIIKKLDEFIQQDDLSNGKLVTNLFESLDLDLSNNPDTKINLSTVEVETVEETLSQTPKQQSPIEQKLETAVREVKRQVTEQTVKTAVETLKESSTPEKAQEAVDNLSKITQADPEDKAAVLKLLQAAQPDAKSRPMIQILETAVKTPEAVKLDELPKAVDQLQEVTKMGKVETLTSPSDLAATREQVKRTIDAFAAAGMDRATVQNVINESMQSWGVKLVEEGVILSPQAEQQVIQAVSAKEQPRVSISHQQELEQVLMGEQATPVRIAPVTRRSLMKQIIERREQLRERLKWVKDKAAYKVREQAMQKALDKAMELNNQTNAPVDGKTVLYYLPNLAPQGDSEVARYNDGSLSELMRAIQEINAIKSPSEGRWKLRQTLENNRPVTLAPEGEDVDDKEISKVLQGRQSINMEGTNNVQLTEVSTAPIRRVVAIPQRTLPYAA